MAKYGSDAVQIEFDNSSGTLVDMTQYVTEIGDFSIEMPLEDSTPLGSEWDEAVTSGVKTLPEITLRGFFDDTATTGPDVIFNAVGDTRTLKVTWGGTKTTTVETIIRTYKRIARRKENTKYEVTLKPTGAVVEA